MPTECACFKQPEGTAFTWCNLLGLCLGWPCFGLPCCYCRVSEEEKKKLPEWFKPRKGQKFELCTCLLMFCVSPFLWGAVVFWREKGGGRVKVRTMSLCWRMR